MNTRLRKVISIACAVSLLLTGIPFRAYTEGNLPPLATPTDQVVSAPENAQETLETEELEIEDVTIPKNVWAHYVIKIPQTLDKTSWTLTEKEEARKEHVIRIESERDIDLFFLLTTDADAAALISTEENESRKKFTDTEENEIPALADETGNHYILKSAHIEADGSRLIRIKSATPIKFTLKVMTGSAWQKLTAAPTEEETKEVEETENTTETAETEKTEEAEETKETEEKTEAPTLEVEELTSEEEKTEEPKDDTQKEQQEEPAGEKQEEPTQESTEEENNEEPANSQDEENTETPIEAEELTEEPTGENQEEQEEPAQEPAEEENNEEPAEEPAGENQEEPAQEPTEEENSEEPADEPADENQEEPAQESAEEENNEEPAEEPAGENQEEPAQEPAEEENSEEPTEEPAGENEEEQVQEPAEEENNEEPAEEPADENQQEPAQEPAEEENNEEPEEITGEENAETPAEGEESAEELAGENQEEPTEETQEEILFQESPLVFYGKDFTVTVNFGEDAGFLQGTELHVREILPGTEEYRLYSGQTEEVLNENWDEVAEFARFFDITFVYNGVEIEPLAPIDVQITFADAISVAEDNDLQAIHFAEEGAQVISSDTQSVEAAVHDDTAVDTVAFSSDSFSVYGFVQTAKITKNVITADGNTYKIDVTYQQDSEIPVNADLVVNEILPEDERYEALLQEALQAAGGEIASYARFFDIEIQTADGKVEPQANVSVSIALDDVPEVESDELKVVHFAEEETVVLDAEAGEDSNIQFETDSFSVYGVITVPANASTEVTDLDGRTFRIQGYTNNYMTNSSYENTKRFYKTTNVNDAAVWQFESASEEGKYYISTIAESRKQYLRLNRHSGDYAHGELGDEPQAFTVTKDGDGKYYFSAVSRAANGSYHTYYLYEADSGFLGLHEGEGSTLAPNDSCKLTIDFTELTLQQNHQYILLVKYEGSYYVIHNDGTLMPVDDPDEVAGQYKIDDPMLWYYNGENLYHHHKEIGFTWQNLASDYLYRYLEPDEENGYKDEEKSDVTSLKRGEGYRPDNYQGTGITGDWEITARPFMDQTKINYTGNKISSKDHPENYIGIKDTNGKLTITGQCSADEAAEIYFVQIKQETAMSYSSRHHTVNHIDISIDGHVEIEAPLAYGTYYYKDGSGTVQTLVVSKQNPVTVEMSKDIKIDKEDVMRANISAYTIDSNGTHHTMDNAFYVSGFSGNAQNDISSNQTRIEGSFKVADLPDVQYWTDTNGVNHYWIDGFTDNNNETTTFDDGDHKNRLWGYDNGDDSNRQQIDSINAQRLKHPIYYSVSTTKEVEFVLKYGDYKLYETAENAALDDPQNDDQDGVMKGVTTVTLGNSFNYWDLRNECPPLSYGFENNQYNGTNRRNWMRGALVMVGDNNPGADDGSGMDFKLGTVDKKKYGILAVEITKYIVDTSGNVISPKQSINNVFHVYRMGNPSEATVNALADKDVNKYENGAVSYDGYTLIHDKKTTVSTGGFGSVYDYDVNAGMVYIEEDSSDKNLPKVIEDGDGKQWIYKGTRIETEYVWRDNGIEDAVHVSKEYTIADEGQTTEPFRSHPEVLGSYKDVNDIDRYNGFVEFYVYNIYEAEPIDVPVRKVWKHENGTSAQGPDEAVVDVELGRYKMVVDTENPITGTLTITHNVDGWETNQTGTYYATYKLWQGKKQVRTFSYDKTNETQILTNLPAGNYTLEVIENVNGYLASTNPTALNVTIAAGKNTTATIDTTLTSSILQTVDLTVHNYDEAWNDALGKTYTFPAGATVVFTIFRPSQKFESAGFWVTLNGGTYTSPTQDSNEWTYVEQNWEYIIPNENTTLTFQHNWGHDDFRIKSITLKNNDSTNVAPPASANASDPTQQTTNSGETSASGSEGGTASSTGKIPESTVPGMKFVDDSSFSEWLTLGNGVWEDVFTDLPAVDENGYQYLYYIRNVEEESGTTIVQKTIELAPGDYVLTSTGETTLQVTNTIADEKPNVIIRKIDEDGHPLTGVTFKINGPDYNNVNFTINSSDGTYVLNGSDGKGLSDGTYTISEESAPDSPIQYKTTNSNITFNVVNKVVTDTTDSSFDDISFIAATYTYTVTNTPEPEPGKLQIIKRWEDAHGNVMSAPASASVTLKIKQMVMNEGEPHNVTVNFYVKGDGTKQNASDDLPNNYEKMKTFVATRPKSNVRGTATIEWHWNEWTHLGSGNIILQDQSGNPVDYAFVTTSDDNSTMLLTIWDDGTGNDVSIDVIADNYNWRSYGYGDEGSGNGGYINDINYQSITNQGSGYTLTGGEKTITLPNEGKWFQELAISGVGLLTESSTTLPATYMGRTCHYVITEEDTLDDYAVSYSNSNTNGVGIDTTGVWTLTAYNRKISTDVKVIKVDQTNHEIKLQGAKFIISKINPAQKGVVYMSWVYPRYPSGTTELVSDENGVVDFHDLPNGYYEIQETAAPNENYVITGDGCIYIKVLNGNVTCIEKDVTKRPDKWHTHRNDSFIMVSRNGEITIGNEPNYGGLKITKNITVNGAVPVPDTSDAILTNGTFKFSIVGVDNANNFAKDESHTLEITFENGKVKSYKIDRDLPVTFTAEQIAAATHATWSVFIPDLKPGDYTITETDSGNLTLASISGGKNNGDVSSKSVTVTVTAGKNTEESIEDIAKAKVAFTNNRELVNITATKTWKSAAGTDINTTMTNATVTFTLQSSTDGGTTWTPALNDANVADYQRTMTVTTANSAAWTVNWTNLLKYTTVHDSENDVDTTVLIQYRVVETDAKIMTDVGSGTDVKPAQNPTETVVFTGNAGTANIDNTLPTTQINVNKTWDSSGWPDSHIQVGMTLQAGGATAQNLPDYTPSGEGQTPVSQGAVHWLTSSESTTGHTWYNLPVYTDAGRKIAYTVVETGMRYVPDSGDAITIDPDNWKSAFTTTPSDYIGIPDADGAVTIVNTPKTTSIQLTKVWTLNGENKSFSTDTEITYSFFMTTAAVALDLSTYTLEADKGTPEANKIKYVTTDPCGWQTVTISNLPQYELTINDSTVSYSQINYYAVESVAQGSTTRVSYQLGTGNETSTGSEAAANSGIITIYNRDTDVNIKILKVDSNNSNTKLSGAVFQILKDDGTNNYAPYDFVNKQPATDSAKEYASSKQTTGNTGEDLGKLSFTGLLDGKYKIVETRAPDGYNNTNINIFFTITDGAVTWTTDGTTIVTDENEPNLIAYNTATKEFTVGNTPGVELPATGGSGTALYTVLGLMLTLLAGCLLILRKRTMKDHR